MTSTSLLLALPIATGAATVLWSRVAASSPAIATSASAVSTVLAAVMLGAGPSQSNWPGTVVIVAYLIANALDALLWANAATIAPIGVLALAQSASPLVVLAMSWIGGAPAQLDLRGWIGAALIMVGSPLIAMGSSRA